MATQPPRDDQVKNLIAAIDQTTRHSAEPLSLEGRLTSIGTNETSEILDVAFGQHQRVAEHFAASASSLVSEPVHIQVTSVDLVTPANWRDSLAYPACIAKTTPKTKSSIQNIGEGILHIEAQLAFRMIDRMLGGTPQMSDWGARDMTPIESGLLQRLTDRFAQHWFAQCWDLTRDALASASLERPTRNTLSSDTMSSEQQPPDAKSLRPANETPASATRSLIRVGMTCSLLGGRGNWTCLMPVSRLANWPRDKPPQGDQAKIVVEMIAPEMSAQAAATLRDGDVIQLDAESFQGVDVMIDESSKWKATLGHLGDRKAIQIQGRTKPKA